MSPRGVHTQETVGSLLQVPLYLHVFSPRYYTDPPKPPERILTMQVRSNAALFVAVGTRDETVSGKIESTENEEHFHARIWTKSATSLKCFDGEMALDRFEVSSGGLFSGGAADVLWLFPEVPIIQSFSES